MVMVSGRDFLNLSFVLTLLGMLTLSGCAMRGAPQPEPPTHALTDASASRLLAWANAGSAANVGRSGVLLLENGVDAFVARAVLARHAEATLDIQYYIIHDGLTTRALMHEVVQAAARGVRVRILLDDSASRGNDFGVARLSAHPNIDVRLFNPMYAGRRSAVGRAVSLVTNLNRLHRRMHNKLWLADNALGITGGRNLGDEYYGAAEEVNFTDVDIMAAGPVVKELSASFDAYWNSPNSVPVEHFIGHRPTPEDQQSLARALAEYVVSSEVRDSVYARHLAERLQQTGAPVSSDIIWADLTAVWDDPAKVNSTGIPPENQLLVRSLQPLFAQVRDNVTLVSAYFVPGQAGVDSMRKLRERGISVSVLTNSLAATDVAFVYGAYAGYRQPLLESGVELHEIKAALGRSGSAGRFGIFGSSGASLHTKVMVFDDHTSFVGSFNIDPRSTFWNTEVGVVIRSEAFTRRLKSTLDDAFAPENSYRLVLDGDTVLFETSVEGRNVVLKKTPASAWKRFQSWLSGTVAPETMM